MKKLLLTGLIFASIQSLGQTYFQKIIGTPATDKSFGVLPVTGGYVLSGHASNDLLLLKIDHSGNTIWKKTYGGTTQTEEGKVLVKTPDGGFLVTGYSQLGAGLFDAIITKTDSLGNFEWSKTYGDNQHNKAWPIDMNSIGEIYIAGWSEPAPNTAPATAFVIKANNAGDTIWTRKIGIGGKNYFRSLAATNDDGCIAVGETDNFGVGGFDILAVKFDQNGDTLWTRTLGSSGDDYGWSVKQTSDNGYIIVGNTGSFGYTTNLGDAIIIKLTSTGSIQWTKTIGDGSNRTTLDGARSVTQTQDGNIIFCGYSGIPGPSGNEQGWVAKLNIMTGDTIWTRFYPIGSSNEHFRYISEISAGEYVVSGYTNSLGAGNDDIFIMKLRDDGFPGGCNESLVPMNFSYNNQNLNISSGVPLTTTSFITNIVTGNYNPSLTESILCTSTIGLDDIEKSNRFNISPNPFSDYTFLQTDLPLSNANLTVLNSFGQVVKIIKSTMKERIILHRDNLPRGLYFVVIMEGNTQIETIKLVIGD